MKTIEQLKSMNKNNFERDSMNKIFGGVDADTATLTWTPGSDKPTASNDGKDSLETVGIQLPYYGF